MALPKLEDEQVERFIQQVAWCDQRKLMKLLGAGHSLGDIARELKLTKTTVYRITRAAKVSEK
jgi:hypothetical protein